MTNVLTYIFAQLYNCVLQLMMEAYTYVLSDVS